MSPVSFAPEHLFVEENQESLQAIVDGLRADFPETGAVEALEFTENQPSPMAMRWMWLRLMGRQHSNMEAGDSKLILSAEQAARYWPLVQQLHYGEYPFTEPVRPNSDMPYSKGLVLGGTPGSMTNLLHAAAGGDHPAGNICDIILMAGQRLRWDIPAEASIQTIYDAIAQESGADMDDIRERSPWLKTEESLPVIDSWHQPFATEFEIGRATVEAVFRHIIDWSEYPVELTPAHDQIQDFTFRGQKFTVPEREIALVTYSLTNGTRVHILNGRATNRHLGIPRPNSDSQTTQIAELFPGASDEEILVVSSIPHVRAGIDIATRFLALYADQPDKLKSIDLATSNWMAHSTIMAALGEIPATHKADLRLRAALAGQDPDTPNLINM